MANSLVNSLPLLVLVGPSGSGRTTVGSALANQLGTKLVETEDLILFETGLKVTEFLTSSTPEEFQEMVQRASLSLLSESSNKTIVTLMPSACGFPSVQQALQELGNHGIGVAALKVTIAELAKRAGLNAPRSMALGRPRTVFTQFVRAMEEQYPTFAPVEFDNGGFTPTEVAFQIIQRFALE